MFFCYTRELLTFLFTENITFHIHRILSFAAFGQKQLSENEEVEQRHEAMENELIDIGDDIN